MLDTAILAFTTLFATIGPLDVAAMFAVLTARDTAGARLRTALRSTLVATIVLLLFALPFQYSWAARSIAAGS